MLLLGTVTRMVFSFAFVVYVARYLGVETYGKFALTQSLYDLCTSLCATGFCILVTREAAKNLGWLIRNLAPVVAIIVILSCVAAVCAGDHCARSPGTRRILEWRSTSLQSPLFLRCWLLWRKLSSFRCRSRSGLPLASPWKD